MPVAPSPSEIFERAAEEGERRLGQSMLELVATSFIAGFTIVFGLAALGIVHALVKPEFSNFEAEPPGLKKRGLPTSRKHEASRPGRKPTRCETSNVAAD